MRYLEWSDALSVGVREIDAQHQKLVEMINSLNAAMLAQAGRAAQKGVIEGMVDYAGSHFVTEERYMQSFGYSGLPTHKTEHEQFTKKALDLKSRVQKAGFVLTLEIVDFLRDWLVNHIQKTDKAYQKCFNDHGLR